MPSWPTQKSLFAFLVFLKSQILFFLVPWCECSYVNSVHPNLQSLKEPLVPTAWASFQGKAQKHRSLKAGSVLLISPSSQAAKENPQPELSKEDTPDHEIPFHPFKAASIDFRLLTWILGRGSFGDKLFFIV